MPQGMKETKPFYLHALHLPGVGLLSEIDLFLKQGLVLKQGQVIILQEG